MANVVADKLEVRLNEAQLMSHKVADTAKCWQISGHPEPPTQIYVHRGISPFGRRPDCPVVIKVPLCSYSPLSSVVMN